MLGRHWGIFLEAAASYCRIRSLSGSGRESRMGISDDTTWRDLGDQREKITTSWYETEVEVPTNFWGAWTAAQRQRDFVLDLSGLRLAVDFFIASEKRQGCAGTAKPLVRFFAYISRQHLSGCPHGNPQSRLDGQFFAKRINYSKFAL